jgi:hypothetical protein
MDEKRTWQFGIDGDLPFVVNENMMGVFRPSTGVWYFGDGVKTWDEMDEKRTWQFGIDGDLPFAGI